MPGSARSTVTARARLVLLLIALGGLVLAAAGPDRSGQARTARPTDRGMFVSVLGKDGAPVAGLTAADFVVREDGVAREVLGVERATEPITLALVIDNSQAAAPHIADMREGIRAFAKRLAGKNPMAVTVCGERPSIFTDYTLDAAAIEKGIDRLFPMTGSGSYLVQAVDEVAKGLAKREFERAVIVAVTNGGPEFTERYYQDFIPRLRDSGATFHAIVIAPRPPNLSDYGERNRELFLEAAPRATGGNRVTLLSSQALAATLKRLADELTNQYRLTYARPETLIPPERIEVSVKGAGLVARGTPIKPRKQ